MNQQKNRQLLQLLLFVLATSGLLLIVLAIAPTALARNKRERFDREQKIIEATTAATSQMAIEKEIRRMSIRHKPRPVPVRKIR